MKDQIVEEIKKVLTKGNNENEYYIPYAGLWYFDDNLDLIRLFEIIYKCGFSDGKNRGKKEKLQEIQFMLGIDTI
jgi:hypothetical protein